MARMMLAILKAAHEGRQEKHIGQILERMLVSLVIIDSADQGAPATATEIANRLGIPRSNVRRAIDALVATGRVQKIGLMRARRAGALCL
jgi:DNA-binding MarR family transcriptional regulator